MVNLGVSNPFSITEIYQIRGYNLWAEVGYLCLNCFGAHFSVLA